MKEGCSGIVKRRKKERRKEEKKRRKEYEEEKESKSEEMAQWRKKCAATGNSEEKRRRNVAAATRVLKFCDVDNAHGVCVINKNNVFSVCVILIVDASALLNFCHIINQDYSWDLIID